MAYLFWYPLNGTCFPSSPGPRPPFGAGSRHPDDELVGQAVFTNEAAKALTGAQLSVTETWDLGRIWGRESKGKLGNLVCIAELQNIGVFGVIRCFGGSSSSFITLYINIYNYNYIYIYHIQLVPISEYRPTAGEY